jgi:protocatechuate 3,4-dioxygenase alpha subunit
MTRPRATATSSQTVGPFFHFALATNEALGRVAGPETPGERIRLRLRVLDGDGLPVPDALVEIYQADASGMYATTADARSRPPRNFTGFGRLPTDGDGVCIFETIKPGPISTAHGVQAPHVNVCLLARGLLRQVYTRIYFTGDREQHADPLLRLVPPDRAATLMAKRLRDDEDTPESRALPPESPASTWEVTVRLQGDDETVFFDL